MKNNSLREGNLPHLSMYNIQDTKKLYQHSRIVNHLPRHFQSLELDLAWDDTKVQQVIQSLLNYSQGRIYVELRQHHKKQIFVAFEEPSDLTLVTLALPVILAEKNH